MLSVANKPLFAESRYAERWYAECFAANKQTTHG
jgi:hypothetical protein